MVFGSKILDKIKMEEKETISITVDKSVYKKLLDMKEKKKLKKISPLINELIKDWLLELEKEARGMEGSKTIKVKEGQEIVESK